MLHALLRAVLVLACAAGAGAAGVSARAGNGSRHAFYRSIAKQVQAGSRRVFGGASVDLSAFPPTCVLTDRYWATRCSGAVLTPHWVLTAAHCVTPQVAYILYNTRRPTSRDSKTAKVMYMYRHPDFKVREEDEGRGLDVTALLNDVGMLRTSAPMQLSTRPAVQSPMDPVRSLNLYNLQFLTDTEVQVLGFGGTERSALGEELFEVRLRAVPCERASWEHCMCGVGQPAGRGGARGVCAGDSGGPVVFRGAQVGVTSMGPIECSTAAEPAESATSVFTSLYQYSALVNATIYDTEQALKMRRLSQSPAGALTALPAPLVAAALLVRALR